MVNLLYDKAEEVGTISPFIVLHISIFIVCVDVGVGVDVDVDVNVGVFFCAEAAIAAGTLRRSGRNAGKTVKYNYVQICTPPCT